MKQLINRSLAILVVTFPFMVHTAAAGGVALPGATFSVGGNVQGLSGTVVLQNNGANDLIVTKNGAFVFTQTIVGGGTYNVTVKTQPAKQTCSVTNGSGKIAGASVTNVSVTCASGASAFTVGGTVGGLVGSVVLQTNGADLPVNANGTFVFATPLISGSAYSVTVKTQPSFPAQDCVIANGSGTIGTTNVTNVGVTCTSFPAAALQADPDVGRAQLSWTNPVGVARSNLYMSSARHCDIRNYTLCPGAALINNVTSPRMVASLVNGQPYFFQLESVFQNGAHGVSNEAGAQPNRLAFNDRIMAIAPAANGTVYVGGAFTSAGILSGGAVPLDTISGAAAGVFPVINGVVRTIVADGAGGWYLGGAITSVDNTPRSNLVHLLADGTVDPAFNVATNGTVRAIVVSTRAVYLGGDFTTVTVNGIATPRNHLAAITGGMLNSWDPNASGEIRAFTMLGDTIYIAGSFNTIAGASRIGLAAVNEDGVLSPTWKPFAPGGVLAMAALDGKIYLAGGFNRIETGSTTTTRNFLAAINTNGSVAGWNPNASSPASAIAIAGTIVYVGGTFSTVRGAARNRLAAVDLNGALLPWNPSADNSVTAVVVAGSTIYVGGGFTRIGSVARSRLAAIDANGALLPWKQDVDNSVNTLAAAGSTIYAGGRFNAIRTTPRNHLAAINTDGSLSTTWSPGVDGFVFALALSTTPGVDRIYTGGTFTSMTIGGTTLPRNRLAAINVDGSPSTWNPDADARVFSLAVSGSTVLSGGDFTTVSGLPRSHAAAIDESGIVVAGFRPDPDGTVLAIATSGGRVYMGGSFTHVGGVIRNALAALNPDGTLTSWNPDLQNPNDISNSVSTIAIAGSTVYAGGIFGTAGGVARRNVAAINVDGTLLPWNPGADNLVSTLVTAGNVVYAGGSFTAFGSLARKGVAAIGADGSMLPWNPIPENAEDSNSAIEEFALSGNTLYMGGSFTKIRGALRPFFGAVRADGVGEVIP